MSRGLITALAMASLALAAPAGAAYTIGPSPLVNTGSTLGGGTFTAHQDVGANSPAPSSGVIVQFSAFFGTTGSGMAYRVVRTSAGNVTGVATVPIATPAPNALNTTSVRVPIAAGDTIGVDTGSIRTRFTAGRSYGFRSPPVPDDGTVPTTAQAGQEAMLNAVVEPDADADGFGDESQDPCPGDSAPQSGGCTLPAATPVAVPPAGTPAVAQTGKGTPTVRGGTITADSKGKVPVSVSCPPTQTAGCAGTVGLELPSTKLARSAASVAYDLRAGASTKVKVALTKKGLKLLKKRKKLAVRVVVTPRSGAVIKAKATLKAPKAAKKKEKKKR